MFQVSVVIENLDLTDEVLDGLICLLPDAVPASVGGVVTVSSPVEAPDAKAAAFVLVGAITDLFPVATVVRLDQDLVAIPDIAERVGRSRESIRLLVDGRRGPGGFPSPVGIVGDGIRIWPWATVADWFVRVLGEDLGEVGVPPAVAAAVDAHLAESCRPAIASGS